MTRKQILALDRSLYNMRSRLPGKTWTAQQFIVRFQRYFPYIANVDVSDFQSRWKLSAAYTDINKLLRTRGLAIKSSGYYTKFSIIEDAGKKVQRQRVVVQRITASANDLNQGLFAFGGQYSARQTAAEIDAIVGESAFYPGRISY